MGNRASIKPDRDLFDTLNDDREDRGMTWNEYLRYLHDDAPAPDQVQVSIDDEEMAAALLEEITDEGELFEVSVDTEQLAKDIAGYAGGGEFDIDRLADRVAERVSDDVRETMRGVMAR